MNGLELISVAFSKHLSAGLTFLMDKLDGDLIEKIIEMCTEKLMEEKSEIRSKSIKVIESISNIVNKGRLLIILNKTIMTISTVRHSYAGRVSKGVYC